MKKILIILVSIVVISSLIWAINKYRSLHTSTSQTQISEKWLNKYPQLGKIGESLPALSTKATKNQESLVGTITNKFGIRDDILEYILQTAPKDNQQFLNAIIKNSSYLNQTYYAPTDKEKLDYMPKWALSGRCASMFAKDMNEYINISRQVESMMRDTPERDKYMWDTDRRVFSWKVVSSGLNQSEEEIACKEGKY